MSGSICTKCLNASNDAAMPVCDDANCPGRQTFKPVKPSVFVHTLMKDSCEHLWDGPPLVLDGGRGTAVTCSKCKIDAITHSLRQG